jgi:cytosine/adenosine deaminase-related metal-dependent hydrolase
MTKNKNPVRKISATYIFPVSRAPLKNGILICEDDGTILDLVETGGKPEEIAGLEYYSGILVPGFVNAHCHLELSHLKGKIPEKAGIGSFVGAINQLRNEDLENVAPAIHKADRSMYASGIVAVGDISNTLVSIDTKLKSKIVYHTFVETFGFHPSRAERAFAMAKFVQHEFVENCLSASVTPHSPYSVSEPLFQKIRENSLHENPVLTIHNQESKAEMQFFENGSGPIAHHLQNNLGIDISHWQPAGESSLAFALRFIPAENQLLLVHNTFTEKKDIEWLKNQRSAGNTFFVLCPNSNLFIENQFPPVDLFRKENLNICLGTDSFASNRQLSILSEMMTIQQNFPGTELSELINWATINGAKALRMETRFGSFEKGKNPGINLISGVDLRNMKLTGNRKVKRLV